MRRFSAFGKLWLVVGLMVFSVARAERLPMRTYTIADGLLRDAVYKIKQDSRGFLWFCTGEGISRFDGYVFANFTVRDGLPPGAVYDFLETKDGAIYLGTDGGLAKLARINNSNSISDSKSQIPNQNNSLFTVVAPENPKAKAIKILYQDADGTVWAGTSSGLYKLNAAGELENVNLGESKNEVKEISVTAIVKDRRGSLWIGTFGGGLFRIAADGTISQFTTADGMPGNLVESLLEMRDGRLWAGMRWDDATAGLVRLNPQADGTKEIPIARHAFTFADGLPSYWIPTLLETSDGKFWLGTVGGLCLWQGEDAKSVCKTYFKENDLGGIASLAEDKDGNLWVGANSGVKKVARYGFTTYNETDGIESRAINSLFENRRGEFFATIIGKGRTIYRFDGEKFKFSTPYFPPEIKYFGWGGKQTVWQDSAGAWIVPVGNKLFKFAPEAKFENLDKTLPQNIYPAKKGGEVFRFFEDSRGDYWTATASGVSELWHWQRDANAWRDLTAEIALSANRLVMAFVEDRSGNVWIGTGTEEVAAGGQLIRYYNGEVKIFTKADGVPDGWIRDLYVDSKNRLWIANTKNGLLRLDDVNANELNFVRYSTADGLSSAGAYCVTEDAFGRMYVGSARGIDRLNPETGQIENFTTADGLPASSVELAQRDKNNDLWFGTDKGLTRYVPEPVRERQPPTILITNLRINGEARAISILGEKELANVELNADQKQISIDFIGLGASLGEQLKYEYSLNSEDWTRANERTVNFANLAPGSYQFKVRAATADRIYSRSATVGFQIAAPIYQRWWFIISALALIALAAFAAYRYRLNRLLEIERTRTRIASDLHDDIGTNLSKISLLSEIINLQLADQNAESHRLLDSIAEISRESVNSMSDIVWAINPQRDSVAEIVRRMRLHAEEISLDKNVRVRFDAPEESAGGIKLSMNARRELFLIFKEAVSNAIRHSECRTVEIDFRVENGAIFLRVADDGKGFDAANKTDGNGLNNMRNRAARSSGKLEIESAVGRGAVIKIRFPQN